MGTEHEIAPKARNVIAQDSALGSSVNLCSSALKGRHNFSSAPLGQAIIFHSYYPGRCPGHFILPFQGNDDHFDGNN